MSDDLRTGPDGQANHLLSVLRESAAEGPLGPGTEILPGLVFHAHAGLGAEGHWRSPPGRLLDLEVTTTGEGPWMALHLSLGAPDLAECGVVGLACRSAAADQLVIRTCLRSGTADGFEDSFFDKHLLARPEEATYLDALPVHRGERVPLRARWRELVLFLPTRSLRWSLIDLRVFAV